MRLKDGLGSNKVYDKNDVFIIGTDDIGFNSPQTRTISRIYYKHWNDFRNSAMYCGAEVYSQTVSQLNRLKPYQLGSDYLIGVDLGSSSLVETNFYADRSFRKTGNGILFGWKSGDNAMNTLGGNSTYPYLSIYWKTTRQGSFTYQFSGLPNRHLQVVLDFLEQWQTKSGMRQFSLEVETEKNVINLHAIDFFSLGGNEPVTIAVNIGETKTLRISLIQDPGSQDIPIMSGIRIYPMRNSSCNL